MVRIIGYLFERVPKMKCKKKLLIRSRKYNENKQAVENEVILNKIEYTLKQNPDLKSDLPIRFLPSSGTYINPTNVKPIFCFNLTF
jgi:hypothetical protein